MNIMFLSDQDYFKMPPLKIEDETMPVVASTVEEKKTAQNEPKKEYKMEIVWTNLIIHTVLHATALYGLTVEIWRSQWYTLLFAFVLGWFSNLGITAGAHRLWSHKAYSAKLPLRIFLAIIASLSCQNSIYIWCRDHRVHHKFTETDGDPHNAKRGFFFSHVGWLIVKKHPEVIEKGAKLDYSDMLNDPVVKFQHKFYYPLILMISFVLPTVVPYFLWNESLWNAYFVAAVMRLVLTLNIGWCVNSVAHMWGNHPYDETIEPAENIAVSFFALGEGWHNYHHAFPFDYRASELPWKLNPTTQFIDLMHLIGQAYGLKYMSKEAIRSRATKYGDGSIYPRGDKTN
ncbi:putative stearoyl-CoA desaturase [Apostichopus japonicus]|uniref:Putative stearoyl-CoA desaturase n=1 Tax=Stichopus japonicus TaxID=307972 RepID=A0A2G8KCV5_STIJA|nr:putative stearoyl-CoA desaturase [Apostichopus japonicus]